MAPGAHVELYATHANKDCPDGIAPLLQQSPIVGLQQNLEHVVQVLGLGICECCTHHLPGCLVLIPGGCQRLLLCGLPIQKVAITGAALAEALVRQVWLQQSGDHADPHRR